MSKGRVYGSTEELIKGVSAETGVAPDDVRKVLRASFDSTKDFVLKQLGEMANKSSGGKELSDAELANVSGGAGLIGQTQFSAVNVSQLRLADVRLKLVGAINS